MLVYQRVPAILPQTYLHSLTRYKSQPIKWWWNHGPRTALYGVFCTKKTGSNWALHLFHHLHQLKTSRTCFWVASITIKWVWKWLFPWNHVLTQTNMSNFPLIAFQTMWYIQFRPCFVHQTWPNNLDDKTMPSWLKKPTSGHSHGQNQV